MSRLIDSPLLPLALRGVVVEARLLAPGEPCPLKRPRPETHRQRLAREHARMLDLAEQGGSEYRIGIELGRLPDTARRVLAMEYVPVIERGNGRS